MDMESFCSFSVLALRVEQKKKHYQEVFAFHLPDSIEICFYIANGSRYTIFAMFVYYVFTLQKKS